MKWREGGGFMVEMTNDKGTNDKATPMTKEIQKCNGNSKQVSVR